MQSIVWYYGGIILKPRFDCSRAYTYPMSKMDLLLQIALARYFPPTPVMLLQPSLWQTQTSVHNSSEMTIDELCIL